MPLKTCFLLVPCLALAACGEGPEPTGQVGYSLPLECGLPPNAYADVTVNASQRAQNVRGTHGLLDSEEAREISLSVPGSNQALLSGTVQVITTTGVISFRVGSSSITELAYLRWQACERDYGRTHEDWTLEVIVPRGQPVTIVAEVVTATGEVFSTGHLLPDGRCSSSSIRFPNLEPGVSAPLPITIGQNIACGVELAPP
jgi:hypothetical protein